MRDAARVVRRPSPRGRPFPIRSPWGVTPRAVFDRLRSGADQAEVVHPSGVIPQRVVDKVVARRGRLHVYETLDPKRAALTVIDLDEGSCRRDDRSGEAIGRVNEVAVALRAAGGVVAFVTSDVVDPDTMAGRLGSEAARAYYEETRPGGLGTMLDPRLDVGTSDVRAVKTGASAFFPGSCDLHDRLQACGVDTILITGMVTNVCCESSARDACELGYKVTMISDANLGHSWGLHEASLTTFFRVFGDVRPSYDVIRLITPVPDAPEQRTESRS
jgi:ureidoacrylate peracid hydrolase